MLSEWLVNIHPNKIIKYINSNIHYANNILIRGFDIFSKNKFISNVYKNFLSSTPNFSLISQTVSIQNKNLNSRQIKKFTTFKLEIRTAENYSILQVSLSIHSIDFEIFFSSSLFLSWQWPIKITITNSMMINVHVICKST